MDAGNTGGGRSRRSARSSSFVPELRAGRCQAPGRPVALSLPGTVLPFDQARIYARATGYVAERQVDIGSRVHKGDLLLRIAAPDLDHQLSEAEARLVQMEAALDQARAAGRTVAIGCGPGRRHQHADLAAGDAGLGEQAERRQHPAWAGVETSLPCQRRSRGRVAEASVGRKQATVRRLLQADAVRAGRGPVQRRGHRPQRGQRRSRQGGRQQRRRRRCSRCSATTSSRVQVNVPQSGAVGLQDGLPAEGARAGDSGPRFRGQGGAQFGGARCCLADDAGRSRCAQS